MPLQKLQQVCEERRWYLGREHADHVPIPPFENTFHLSENKFDNLKEQNLYHAGERMEMYLFHGYATA